MEPTSYPVTTAVMETTAANSTTWNPTTEASTTAAVMETTAAVMDTTAAVMETTAAVMETTANIYTTWNPTSEPSTTAVVIETTADITTTWNPTSEPSTTELTSQPETTNASMSTEITTQPETTTGSISTELTTQPQTTTWSMSTDIKTTPEATTETTMADITTTQEQTTEVPSTAATTTPEPTTTTVTTTPEPTTTVTTTPEPTTTTPPCSATCVGSSEKCNASDACVCEDGYKRVDDSCILVCPDTCPANSKCNNAEKGCECDGGYERAPGSEEGPCQDIDECEIAGNCDGDGKLCVNNPGSYSCDCNVGYYPEGDVCKIQPVECKPCSANAACRDPDVGCVCNPGWTGSPNNCVDVNECLTTCLDPTLQCFNTEGSYYCNCIGGYQLNDDTGACEPIQCEENAFACTTTMGGLCVVGKKITFPRTLAGYSTHSEELCEPDTENAGVPFGTRSCSLQGSWQAPVWLTSCGVGIANLTTQPIETEEQRVEVSSNLEVLTSTPNQLDDDDIASTTQVINEVTAADNLTTSVATSVVSSISNVMESPSLASSGQSEQLLTQLDDIASKVVLDNDQPFKSISNNVSMIVAERNDTSSGGVGVAVLVRPNTSSLGFRDDQFQTTNSSLSSGEILDANKIEASIYVPVFALKNSSRVAVYVFGNTNLFSRENTTTSTYATNSSSSNVTVNSMVLSATVEGVTVRDLPPGNNLTFSTPRGNNSMDGTPLCAFWDENGSDWLTDGCQVDTNKTTNTSIACTCDHLTNFATLLDLTGDTAATHALDIITIVGCSISSVALLLIVGVFVFVPNTRRGKKFRASFLLLNLSIALLGLNITLLVSEMSFITDPKNRLQYQSSCMAIAAILHLFMLSGCAWMNCEAAILFLAVAKPIYARSQLRDGVVVITTVLWGWLMPAIFVSVVLGADKSVYIYPYKDGDSQVTCWIKTDMVLYLAVIPVAIMIGANTIVYGILTYKLCRNTDSAWGRSWKSTRDSQKKKTAINFCIMVTIGVTWMFGFFMSASSNETTVLVFAYIFTILNSLQGLFLFLLYVLRNKEARQSIAKEINTLSDSIGFGSKRSRKTSTSRTFSTELSRNPYRVEYGTDDFAAPYSVRMRMSTAAPTHDELSRPQSQADSGNAVISQM